MDKRKKLLSADAARNNRLQFYADVDAGLTLQEAVKRMRSVSGRTQPEFAQHSGVSLRVIKEIESGTGNPTVNTANKIAKIFGMEVAFRRKVVAAVTATTEAAATAREAASFIQPTHHGPNQREATAVLEDMCEAR